MKYRLQRCLAALAVLTLVAGPFSPPAAKAADPYEINAILSLTGPFAFLGNTEAESLRTLEPLVNKNGGINGQPVHFNIQDDQSQPAVAVQLANAIIAKHPAVMLGPTYVASCLAVAPLVRANGPVQYCFAPTIHPPAGSYTFSGGASSYDQAIETLVFAKAKGWKRLASSRRPMPRGKTSKSSSKKRSSCGSFNGMSLILGEHYNGNDVSIGAQLANIKSANPDAILGMTVGTASGTLFRSLRDAGLENVPLLSNLGNLLNSALAQYAPYLPAKVYFTAPRFYAHDVSGKGPVRDAQTAFYDAFGAKRHRPGRRQRLPLGSGAIVIAGLRKLGASSRCEIIARLHGRRARLRGHQRYLGLPRRRPARPRTDRARHREVESRRRNTSSRSVTRAAHRCSEPLPPADPEPDFERARGRPMVALRVQVRHHIPIVEQVLDANVSAAAARAQPLLGVERVVRRELTRTADVRGVAGTGARDAGSRVERRSRGRCRTRRRPRTSRRGVSLRMTPDERSTRCS